MQQIFTNLQRSNKALLVLQRLLILILIGAVATVAQAQRAWIGGATGSWGTASNWLPGGVPGASDAVVFNAGGSITVTNVPTTTIRQLNVVGNTELNLQTATPAKTLTLQGLLGVGLVVEVGSSLNINSTGVINVVLTSGATGTVSGNMTFAQATHTITGAANSLTYTTGSVFTQDIGCTGNVFGTGTTTSNVAVFTSGSSFISRDGGSPFGGTGDQKVVFQPGSLYSHQQAALPSLTGRVYANFEMNFGAYNATFPTAGTAAWTVDNLTITAATNFAVNLNADVNIRGNLSANAGTITFALSSGRNITFGGTSLQAVIGNGTLAINNGVNLVVAASSTVSIQKSFAIGGGLTVNTGGTLQFDLLTPRTLTVTGNLSGAGTLDMSGGNLPHGLNLTGAGNTIGSFIASPTGNSTVSYNGGLNQQIFASSNYCNLHISNGSTKTLQGSTVVNGNLNIGFPPSASSLQVDSHSLTVRGLTNIFGNFIDNSTVGVTTLNEVFIQSGSSMGGSATGIVDIVGNLTLGGSGCCGGNFNLGNAQLTVTGTTTINAPDYRALSITSATGAKSFNNVIINGRWNNTGNAPITINGDLIINSASATPFVSGSGLYTFTGISKEIRSNRPITISSANFVGTYTATGNNVQIINATVSPSGKFTNATTAYPVILPSSTTVRAFNNQTVAFVNKFDRIAASSDPGNTITANNTDFTYSKGINGSVYSARLVDFNPAPTAAIVKFDLAVTSAATTTDAAMLLLGSSFSDDAIRNSAAARLQFNVGVSNSITLTHPDGSPISTGNAHNTRVWWVVNNSGVQQQYTGPNGITYTVNSGTCDLWIGNNRQWNGQAIASTSSALSEIKMVFDNGTGAISLRNLQINPMGQIAISPISCWAPGRIFTIPFTVTQAMTGSNATFNAGNTFRVELSQDNGSFLPLTRPTISFPYNITIPNSAVFNPATNSGTIQALIPANLNLVGPNYRFRIVATDAYTISPDNGTSMVHVTTSLNPQTLDPNNTTGGAITASVTSGFTWIYQTSINGPEYPMAVSGTSYTPHFSDFPGRGQYYVSVRTASGCVSNYVTVYINCGTTSNLIVNGDFNNVGSGLTYNDIDGDGNIEHADGDFYTAYSPVAKTTNPFMCEGCYNVGEDPSRDAKADWCSMTTSNNYANGSYPVFTPSPTSGGNMLIANGDSRGSKILWQQYLGNLKANTDYILTFWAAGLSTGNPQSLSFGVYINCRRVGDDITDRFSSQCKWTKYSIQFNTGSLTGFDLSINNISANGAGNDVAIDDIEFYECAGTSAFNYFNNFVWLGYDNNWFNPDNWGTCSEIPTCSDSITIPSGKLRYPIIDRTGAIARHVTVEAGASLTSNATHTLSICGNVYNSGTITGAGSITFVGTSRQTVEGPGVFTNVVLNQASPQRGVFQKSDVAVDGQLDLRASNFWAIDQYMLTLNGTLSSNTGTITGSNISKMVIGGTGDVVGLLRFTAGSQLLAALTMNRAINGMVTLGTPVYLVGGANALTLTEGLINTTTANLLTMNASSTVTGSGSYLSGGSDVSHINGPMAKETASTSNFTFPVGDFGYLGEIGITPNSTAATTFVGKYFRQSAYTVGSLVESPLDHVSLLEYWTLDRTNGSSNGNVTLHWTSYSDVAVGSSFWQELRVARHNGTIWQNRGPGAGIGTNTYVAPGATYAKGYVTSNLITAFSPFTLATTIPTNPLPVELVDLKATVAKNTVEVGWTTASEHNTDYFEVQRSVDGKSFTAIGKVKAVGESATPQRYRLVDASPASMNYYRLKLIDKDSQTGLSRIVTAQLGGNEKMVVEIFPNPGNGKMFYLKTSYEGKLTVTISNLIGSEVYRETITSPREVQTLHPDLSPGTYVFTVSTAQHTSQHKIIVK